MEKGDSLGNQLGKLLVVLYRTACREELAQVCPLSENFLIDRGVQIIAEEIFSNIVAPVGRTTRCVAYSKYEGDDNHNQQANEYPTTMADEMVLYPGNHFKGTVY